MSRDFIFLEDALGPVEGIASKHSLLSWKESNEEVHYWPGPDRPMTNLRDRAYKFIAILAASAILFTGVGLSTDIQPAEAKTKSSKVMWSAKIKGKTAILRYGTKDWGYVHIKRGGTHGRKDNHELTSAAQKQWKRALNGVKFTKGTKRIYRAHYEVGKKKQKRTMCVIYSTNKKIGMITAYWTKGHVSASKC